MSNPVMTVRRDTRGGRALWLWCPGCDDAHRVMILGEDGSVPPGPCWQWDGNLEAPTIRASLLVRMDFTDGRAARVCHSFVTAGRWEFLGDSTHALAGQTVDLPPVPDWLRVEAEGDQ